MCVYVVCVSCHPYNSPARITLKLHNVCVYVCVRVCTMCVCVFLATRTHLHAHCIMCVCARCVCVCFLPPVHTCMHTVAIPAETMSEQYVVYWPYWVEGLPEGVEELLAAADAGLRLRGVIWAHVAAPPEPQVLVCSSCVCVCVCVCVSVSVCVLCVFVCVHLIYCFSIPVWLLHRWWLQLRQARL
jgi:hypothetical protein